MYTARPVKLERILIVDDEEDIRLVCRLAVGRVGGWETLLASSGPEAVELAARERPDLILLDVMMPGTDGPETLSLLRARAETAEIPIVFLTAKVQQREVDRYLALGALGVIRKPFDPLALPDEIRRITGAGAPGS